MLRLGTALCLIGMIGVGCSFTLDTERAGALFRSNGLPAAPVLRDEPPAKLPAPRDLRATDGQLRQIPLEWDPVLKGDVAGYVVERALEEEGRFWRVATLSDRFATTVVDRGDDLAPKTRRGNEAGDLGDGSRYFYRVKAFDREGRISRKASAIVRGTTAERPARPGDLRTYSLQPRKIALTWQPVDDPTVTGYVVYRSPSRVGDYLPIAEVDGRFQTTYVDLGLNDLRVFYYRVAAVNSSGGEGAATPARRGVTKPEPLPPAGLSVAGLGLGVNELSWEPNVEPNIAGYRLLRRRDGESETSLVKIVAPEETSTLDEEVGAGEKVHYQLIAFDSDGLESAVSDPIEATGIGYRLRAEASRDGVRLWWDEALQAGFESARVIRGGGLRERELARVPRAEYLDAEVEGGRRYRYRVVLVRADGSEAPASETVEIETPRLD